MVTMEELLASQPQKLTNLFRGQEIEGEVISIGDKEITLDLGAKSEGVLASRDLPLEKRQKLKLGDKLKVYVYIPENDNGQTVVSYEKQAFTRTEGGKDRSRGGKGGSRFVDWSKFISLQKQKSKVQGKVIEVNRGGLIVEVLNARGFLPNSQVGFELMSKAGEGMDALIGQDLTVTIIEVDSDNNRLILSERGQVSDEAKDKLRSFKAGQKARGKIVAILPFGLVVNVEGTEGLVFISDVSWEKVEDLSKDFQTGQDLEVLVSGLDEELGRLNLSIKALSEDPFAKIAEKYPADEVVRGEITEVNESGVVVSLEGAEGFLPAAKMEASAKYEVGKAMSFLVDSVDENRRRVNLAPFVTSTAGLIYK